MRVGSLPSPVFKFGGVVAPTKILLLLFMSRTVSGDRMAFTQGTVGTSPKDLQPKASWSDGLLQDAFADLEDEFDAGVHVTGSNKVWMGGILPVLAVAAIGCFALFTMQQTRESELQEAVCSSEALEQEELREDEDPSAFLEKERENEILAEELRAEHQSIPLLVQQEIEASLVEESQELQLSAHKAHEVARDQEYEAFMDASYDALLEQLLEAAPLVCNGKPQSQRA